MCRQYENVLTSLVQDEVWLLGVDGGGDGPDGVDGLLQRVLVAGLDVHVPADGQSYGAAAVVGAARAL